MKFIGNILWFVLTGLLSAFGYFVEGIIWCCTIIGIPYGIQCFKFAKLTLFPFGKQIVKEKSHPIANLLWFILGGFVIFVGYLIGGILWCITILGIPFGKQCFKLARLSLVPFGKTIQ